MSKQFIKNSNTFDEITQSIEKDLEQANIDFHTVWEKLRQLEKLRQEMENERDDESVEADEKQNILDTISHTLHNLTNRVTGLDGSSLETPEEPSYQDRLRKNAYAIQEQGNGWQAAKENILHTERVGDDILNNLSRQRETVLLASGITEDSHHQIGNATRLMRRIRRKLRENKIFLWLLMISLGLLIFVTLYIRAFRYGRPPRSPSRIESESTFEIAEPEPQTVEIIDTPVEIEQTD
ncbi:squalene synthase [Perkinsela sp. CCAP 1560/4]|nr:squalene synthase [Perkinsela sp. CCAP 1560/4]|eukprot:KNH07145.1 squalene synthase [Perkinsela sp. CCAP 1560/4]